MSEQFCNHKFVDSTNCLKCGVAFAELKIADVVEAERLEACELAGVPPAVAAEMKTACDDVPGGKTQDHFKARRLLFAEVDRQIRARVKAILPDITLEFKQQIDQEMGLDALRRRVRTLGDNIQKTADGVAQDAERVSQQLEAMLNTRVEQLLARIEQEAADAVVGTFTKRVQAIVAKEVGAQMTRILMQGQDRPDPSAQRPVRVKKKRTTRG